MQFEKQTKQFSAPSASFAALRPGEQRCSPGFKHLVNASRQAILLKPQDVCKRLTGALVFSHRTKLPGSFHGISANKSCKHIWLKGRWHTDKGVSTTRQRATTTWATGGREVYNKRVLGWKQWVHSGNLRPEDARRAQGKNREWHGDLRRSTREKQPKRE